MNKILIGMASLVAGVTVSTQAFAVKTKDCPAALQVSVGSTRVDSSRIKADDKDIETLKQGLEALASDTSLADSMELVEKRNGSCTYNGEQAKAVLYTREGKDLIFVERNLFEQSSYATATLRVYGNIESMSKENLSIKPQDSYGAMIYFFGNPSPYYDGGFELRPIGSTSSFSVTVE